MNCMICHHGTTHEGFTTLVLDREETTLLFRHVPAEICDNCGEEYLSSAVNEEVLARAEEESEDGTLLQYIDFTARKRPAAMVIGEQIGVYEFGELSVEPAFPAICGDLLRSEEADVIQTLVLEEARRARQAYWTSGKAIGSQTKSAKAVSRAWTKALRTKFGDRFRDRWPVAGEAMKQRLELIDTQDRIAYELKVSDNNPQHDFYRDLFKVLVFNQKYPDTRLQKFVFILPETAMRKFEGPFLSAVKEIAAQNGLEVQISGI